MVIISVHILSVLSGKSPLPNYVLGWTARETLGNKKAKNSLICMGFNLWVSFITLSSSFIFCRAVFSIGLPSSASRISLLNGSIKSLCTARSKITCVSRSAVVWIA